MNRTEALTDAMAVKRAREFLAEKSGTPLPNVDWYTYRAGAGEVIIETLLETIDRMTR